MKWFYLLIGQCQLPLWHVDGEPYECEVPTTETHGNTFLTLVKAARGS